MHYQLDLPYILGMVSLAINCHLVTKYPSFKTV